MVCISLTTGSKIRSVESAWDPLTLLALILEIYPLQIYRVSQLHHEHSPYSLWMMARQVEVLLETFPNSFTISIHIGICPPLSCSLQLATEGAKIHISGVCGLTWKESSYWILTIFKRQWVGRVHCSAAGGHSWHLSSVVTLLPEYWP